MVNVFSIVYVKNSHLITACDINTKSIIFGKRIKGFADTLIYSINNIIKENKIDIRSFNYIAISYNLKSFTDTRLYYCIALSLAQVLKVKVLDITKESQVFLEDIEEAAPSHYQYADKVNEIIENKIKGNSFIDILNARPMYINTTNYKEAKS